MLLEADPAIRVVGEARDGKEAADLAWELKPNLVLMDLRMPRCNGIEALKLIQRLSLPLRVLILAADVRKPDILEALSHGASGVVSKETATDLLRKSISTVMAGQYWIEREGVSDSSYETEKGGATISLDASKKNWGLTPREEQIVGEVVTGKTNKEIADTLGVSTQTVKHHLTSIFDKVGVYNRLELALFCVNYSIVSDAEEKASADTSGPEGRTGSPHDVVGQAMPHHAERARPPAPDSETREKSVWPGAMPRPNSTEFKGNPSRNS